MRENFAQWETLFLLNLKRDWKKIIVWILGFGLFSAAFVPAFKEIAKGNGLLGMFETLQNPAMIAMVGPTPVGTAVDYTLGAMYAHEMLLFCGLFSMVIAVLHVVGHTRKEEDLGLTELVRSFQIGRQANSFAAIMQIVFINLLLTLFISVVMISFDAETISVEGAFLFGASVGIAGIIGAAIALVMVQIMPASSSATGSTLGIIGLLYIIRAGTDVSNVDLSMLNPLGWTYLTYPFTENNWIALVFALIFSLIAVVVAFSLERGRDMGAGYLPSREGRESAANSLLSVHGLFIKLNRGTIISWLIAFIVMGAAYGSIYGDMQTFLESNEIMKQMFAQADVSIEESFTSTIMMVMIALVSILPIAIVNKLFAQENRAYLSQIFATKVTRSRLYWTSIGLAIITGAAGILIAAGSLGGTALSAMGGRSTMEIADFLGSGFNFLPSLLFFIGLASLALGWSPKSGKVVYVYLAYSFLLNYFGGIVDLPEWFSKTAIQSWIPRLPLEDFDASIFITITLMSIALIIIGHFGYNRRDMIEGA
ncbi:ABC transporter permease [Salimicrobium salexigens]|uniref:ABC-2 type transport system permease protein n=1 Tax=Salimicrobium salexigens TaxID=908941 RepID=A0ABY1KXV0_9BACI|nr:tetronasin resistance protein [Salimicrobium salexigens]SIS77303.1 ABC-2 type transport system permease protein [Salimicrobium salexigens]